jgi:hypothetical protein
MVVGPFGVGCLIRRGEPAQRGLPIYEEREYKQSYIGRVEGELVCGARSPRSSFSSNTPAKNVGDMSVSHEDSAKATTRRAE